MALKKIKILEGNIDVLATDLIHGGVDGVELIGKVRKRYPKIKILICTGLMTLPVEVYRYADDVLYKPFEFDELVEKAEMLNGK